MTLSLSTTWLRTARHIAAAALAAMLLAVPAGAPGADLDVPFVTTPMEVVGKMLDLGQVTDRDVVYDLGCGDGRIVIAAARQRGAVGVGIDIDPERIRESWDNAAREGVTDKVWFAATDLFRTDFSEATVVMIYLLPKLNLRLRPALFEQLRPGARVVSHTFDMGQWKPDATAEVGGSTLYAWVVPANVSGSWTWQAEADGREEPFTAELAQDFQKVTGRLHRGAASAPIREARLEGDTLSFSVDGTKDGAIPAMRLEGTVAGNRIAGTRHPARSGWFSLLGGTPPQSPDTPWNAARAPGTARPIDGVRP